MSKKFFKELFIIVLLVLVIVFILYLLFYDVLPSNEDKIISKEYEKNDKTEQVLDEISQTTANDVDTSSDDSLLKSYSITKEDLSEYSDNSYEKGKQDPFAESSEPLIETVKTTQVEAQKNTTESKNEKTEENKVKNEVKPETNTQKEETKPASTSTNTAQNTTKAETQKSTTGKFFEKKNSK